jgi:hypothetical protein
MDTIELKNSPYVRLIFNKLIEGEENDSGKVKYSTAFLLPKNEDALNSIPGLTDSQKKIILDKAKEYKKTVLDAANKEKAKTAKVDELFKCGDERADAAEEEFKEANKGKPVPAYINNTRNMWVVNAGTFFEPKFYGPKGDKLEKDWAEDNIYDGCWVRLETRGYSWSFKGKKGWSIGLAGKVQKWQDAARFATGGGDSDGPVEESMEVKAPEADDEDYID